MKYILFSMFLFLGLLFTGVTQRSTIVTNKSEYVLPWPGILPDHRLYKIKVLRNKIIYKMILTPVKRVEFDLLMADKTLYAAKLLMDKGNTQLAKETALKGENYFSVLVSDYGTVLAKKKALPSAIRQNVDHAFVAHQLLIASMKTKASSADKSTYEQVDYFSKSNYQSVLDLETKQIQRMNEK